MTERKITNLYEHYKNTPKKLKIICDWDEVIQACEPYALWKTYGLDFSEIFTKFWSVRDCPISYSPYGSRLNITENLKEEEKKPWNPNSVGLRLFEKQQEIKNSLNFYQEAPFLTIAEDLLKLIKEDKVEKLIFLSAYDKKKFPYGDERKEKMFKENFDRVGYYRTELDKEKGRMTLPCYLELIPFESEEKGQTKADWIKENASDYGIMIDDNPFICGDILVEADLAGKERMTVIAPHYPAIVNKHHKGVLLVKNEVSDLKKEDFVA